MRAAPHGSWPSPITADLLVQQVVSLSEVQLSGDTVYWNEGRPGEGGRQVVVRWAPGSDPADVVPAGFSARTTVHEYGGGTYCVHGDAVFFSNFDDQRLWRLEPGRDPEAVTSEPATPRSVRYADASVTPDGRRLVCVRERHLDGGEVVNDVVALATVAGSGEEVVVATGHDFFSAPRLSPDGRRLAWLCWDHPRMPWDGSELWVADLAHDGGTSGALHVAGGPEESVSQPRWSPDGVLHWVSDRTGWWNLYADDGAAGRALCPMEAEFSGPDWVFGQSTYAFIPDGRIAASFTRRGVDHLGLLRPESSTIDAVDVPYTRLSSLRASDAGSVVAVAASPRDEPAVVVLDVDTGGWGRLVKASRPTSVDPGYLSSPEALEFPTTGGRSAYVLFYRPANPEVAGPEGERPPLKVISHGGPTGAASPALNLGVQYWTSRGFAVADVNYGGSTGYGRAYRERLKGQWGVVDVEDCVNAARWLAEQGEVDGRRLVVRGGSAGGFTTLCALTFHAGVFAAGASYYGVADLEALAAHTHKFESRYLDGLIGPWPAARELYQRRSPIHAVDRLSSPLILFQGLEDAVVPPAQAEVMVAALRAKGLPFAYVPFPGEQHGFRQAENIKRAVEAELSFYGQVLGFEPADPIEPVEVENL